MVTIDYMLYKELHEVVYYISLAEGSTYLIVTLKYQVND